MKRIPESADSLTESGGPTDLPIGIVDDGQLFKRSGDTTAGQSTGPGSGLDADTVDGSHASAFAVVTRTINTTAPITGGGDLSADRTIALTTSPVGQTPVGVTRNINTTAPITGGGDLSADRTIAISDPQPQSYTPGSFTVATGTYVILCNHLQLTGSQRATGAGTSRIRIT